MKVLNALTQTIAWVIIFFFASAGASSAYLTVSEVFPLEIRAMAIVVFYAIGTGIGGVMAPSVFGALIGSGLPINLILRLPIRSRINGSCRSSRTILRC